MTLHYCTVYVKHIKASIGLYQYCTNASKKLVTEASYSPLTTPLDVVVTQPPVSAMLQPLATTAEVSAQLHQASPSAAATCLHSMTKKITYSCSMDIHTSTVPSTINTNKKLISR